MGETGEARVNSQTAFTKLVPVCPECGVLLVPLIVALTTALLEVKCRECGWEGLARFWERQRHDIEELFR